VPGTVLELVSAANSCCSLKPCSGSVPGKAHLDRSFAASNRVVSR